jgi:Mce-associated membrane protein
MNDAAIDTLESASAETDLSAPHDGDSDTAVVEEEAPVKEATADTPTIGRRLSISIGFRSLGLATFIAVLIWAVATLTWLYIGAQHTLDTQARESADRTHAEKIALDYAVAAAAMNFQDLNAWKAKLVAGTSPELNAKLADAAKSLEQILTPLQWTSTTQPLVARVRSTTGGVFVVDCFVSVQTKTVQAPEPLQSTATYSVTIDSNKNWQITDVGGIGAVAQNK